MADTRRSDRKDDYSGDYPIYSRLFIVCEKGLNQDDFKIAFSSFGEIEDIRMPCDKYGISKGVVYIKFSKTSEAAHALEAMNHKLMDQTRRPLKVMVAANRSEVADEDSEKYRRLFLTVPKTISECDINLQFHMYGHITSIILQKDHNTGESKGFAYITFAKFSQAAHAYEECDKKFRAIFAKPKMQRQPETVFESRIDNLSRSIKQSGFNPQHSLIPMMNMKVRHDSYTQVAYMCCPQFTLRHMERLFDLIPGMIKCKYYVDLIRNVGKGKVTYSNPTSAAYAVEKLHEFEYPPGMLIFVKPDGHGNDFPSNELTQIPNAMTKLNNAIKYSSNSCNPDLAQLAEAIAEASKLIKRATGNNDDSVPNIDDLNYCSVKLPKPQPLAHIDSKLAKRCFLICKPSPPPLNVLRDVFCRFGDLINVYTLPNKTVGYARYASAAAADEAIRVLHGAEICGIRMKVLEADEEAPPRKRERQD